MESGKKSINEWIKEIESKHKTAHENWYSIIAKRRAITGRNTWREPINSITAEERTGNAKDKKVRSLIGKIHFEVDNDIKRYWGFRKGWDKNTSIKCL